MTPAQSRRAQQSAHERAAFQLSLLAASMLHVALAWSLHTHPPAPRPLHVTEIDISPEPPPALPNVPLPVPLPLPDPTPTPKQRAPSRATPPAPAHAGALLTAPEPEPDAPSTDDAPVRFVTDPAGRGFGYGLVTRGGTAEHGEAGAAVVSPAPPPAPPRERIVPPDQLARQPTLLDADCRGHFPQHSAYDLGLVSVVALIQPSGAVARLEIESETPSGQGFARAARACLQRQRFSPALDRHGQPALARTRISIRFAR